MMISEVCGENYFYISRKHHLGVWAKITVQEKLNKQKQTARDFDLRAVGVSNATLGNC